MLPLKNILSFIPQRPPFVMVDTLLYSDETVTRSGFLVQADNIFVENGLLTEPGLVENIAQTAAARAGYIANRENVPVRVGYIGAIKNLLITHLPRVHHQLITEIKIENQIFDVSLISGKVFCGDRVVAQCEMKIFLQNQ